MKNYKNIHVCLVFIIIDFPTLTPYYNYSDNLHTLKIGGIFMGTKKELILFNTNAHYSTVPAVISLSALFPEIIMKSCINCCSDSSENIRNFIRYLLPEPYRMVDEKKDISLIKNDVLCHFWNGNTYNYSEYDKLYIAINKNLLSTSPVSASESHIIVEELQTKLHPITKNIPTDILQVYKYEIYELCTKIVNNRSKFSGLSSVDLYKTFPILDKKTINNETAFLTTLSHLVIIACTSSIWCKPEKKTKKAAENAAQKILPCTETNYIEITYYDGIATVPRICWATLFPDVVLSMMQKSTKKDDILSTKEWFRSFILDEFQTKNGNHLFITDRSDSSFSNYWGGKIEGNASCEFLKDNIVREGKKTSNTYKNFLQHITQRCHNILDALSKEELTDYQKDITVLFSQLQANSKLLLGINELIPMASVKEDISVINSNVSDNKSTVESIDYFCKKLMCLIIIASTWTIWAEAKNQKHAKELATVLFPLKNEIDTEDIRENIIKQSAKSADQKLAKAKEAFHNNEFNKCGKLCSEIISDNLANDETIGDAYFYLVRCHDEFNYHYKGYYNSKEFQSRALSFGSKHALAKWSSRKLDSMLFLPEQAKDYLPFSVITNVPRSDYHMDIYLRSFMNTDDNLDLATHVKNTADFINFVKPNARVHILLIDDKHEKNYLDLLFILDLVKNWNERNKNEKVFTKSAWKNYKIYIRLNETKYASLIDTALKHMDGMTIQVLLIDDNKLAAQYLLSRFPLFYPIRTLSKETLCSNDITINLNIISESDNELTNWIIREAYWLGCFYYTGVTLAINVISPKVQSIMSHLEFCCPEIFLQIPDSDKVSKILWNDQCKLEQLESAELFKYLRTLREVKNSYSYYIINCDSDISSLNLAIKIREWEIRNTVKSNEAIKSTNFPIITYHCENLDISHMAESMVVHQESYGDNWYNNYSIIPFNSTHHYQFSEISGGYFEKMSQSIHLQYYGCDTHALEEKEAKALEEKKAEALEDYFTRCYNRDSSMAVALSIPYRLFQMTTAETDHILPIGWVFKNTDAYSDSVSLNTMAKQAKNYTNKQEMLNYERARWMRYMISRGWQKASSEDTIKFMKAGNPRRQLYIGLLHGCICTQEELKELQEKLYNEYQYGLLTNYDKRFSGNDPRIITDNNKEIKIFDKYLQYDISSLNQTADIILTAWFSERKPTEIEPPEKEP